MRIVNVVTEERLFTVEQFLNLADSKGKELLDGVVVEREGGMKMGWISGEISARLSHHVHEHGGGWVFGANNGLRLWPGREHVRLPSVTFVKNGRLPGNRPVKGLQETVPDLVVDVVAPLQKAGALEQKLADYREAGIPLIWVIYPGTRAAQVLTPTTRYDVFPKGTLDGGEILPGFTLSLEELFRSLDEE